MPRDQLRVKRDQTGYWANFWCCANLLVLCIKKPSEYWPLGFRRYSFAYKSSYATRSFLHFLYSTYYFKVYAWKRAIQFLPITDSLMWWLVMIKTSEKALNMIQRNIPTFAKATPSNSYSEAPNIGLYTRRSLQECKDDEILCGWHCCHCLLLNNSQSIDCEVPECRHWMCDGCFQHTQLCGKQSGGDQELISSHVDLDCCIQDKKGRDKYPAIDDKVSDFCKFPRPHLFLWCQLWLSRLLQRLGAIRNQQSRPLITLVVEPFGRNEVAETRQHAIHDFKLN